MAETFADIRTTFIKILNRRDMTVELANSFFDRAYTRISRELDGPVMDQQATVYVDDWTSVVPILGIKRVYEVWVNETSYMLAPDRLSVRPWSTSGAPTYRWVGREIVLNPPAAPGEAITLLFQQKLTRPEDNEADRLITDEEDLLLYCALSEAAIYYEHDMLKMWEDRYQATLSRLNDERVEQQSQGGGMVIESPYASEYGY